jgi:hypothetical protein
MKKLDVLFVSYVDSKKIYQDLSTNLTTIEPPTWSLLLAQSCRSQGFSVSILDASAENLSLDEAAQRVIENNPRLVCFVVYGQNVNAGTVNMGGATFLSNYLKNEGLSRYNNGLRTSLKKIFLEPFTQFRYSYVTCNGYKDGLIGLFLSFFWAWYQTSALIHLYRHTKNILNGKYS